jgi:uncharacterized protein (DUF58 family)
MAKIPSELIRKIRRIEIEAMKLAEGFVAGAWHSAFKGQGIEFEEAREFATGDDIRSVDWNLTARFGQPYVKVFREERDTTVFLMVDISSSMETGTGKRLKREAIVECVSLLSFAAHYNHDRIGLILFSDRVEHYLSPRKGLRHILRIIRDTLVVVPKGKLSDAKPCLTFLGEVQKKMSIAFLLSDFQFPTCFKEMAVTAKTHDFIGILFQDPLEITMQNVGLMEVKDAETGQKDLIDTSRLELHNWLHEKEKDRIKEWKHIFGKIGGQYLSINTSQPLINPLLKFFKTRKVK